jgi:8-oxo-dGTP pyrophosphatase MutT (NUDIX family)
MVYNHVDRIQMKLFTDKLHRDALCQDVSIRCHQNIETVFSWFLGSFKEVVTGGGIVRDETGRILFIYRNQMWDLPKGHLDKGETIEQCALREVHEETGLINLQLIRPAGLSRHFVRIADSLIIKKNHWFLMQSSSADALLPAAEEGITSARWIGQSELDRFLKLTYYSIREELGDTIREFANEG